MNGQARDVPAAHLRRWRQWWDELPARSKLLPAALLVTYWMALGALHGMRGDLVVSSLALGLLYYGGPDCRPLLGFVLPLCLTNILYDVNLTDIGTCYKAFSRKAVQSLTLESRGFGLEAEITAKICRQRPRLRIYEVPISYSGRT